MARERWFFAQGTQRRGPIPFQGLVETVLAQPDPRSVLVWRKGFADWTRAEDVPEVERRLTPFLVQRAAEDAVRRGPTPAAVEAAARPIRVEEAKPGSAALVYGGIAAGVALLGLLAWLFWPRSQPQPATLPLGGTTPDNAPAVVIPAPTHQPIAAATPLPTPPPTLAPRATPTPAATAEAATQPDRESDIPARDLKRLRGVASWAGDVLKLTVYNGTTWRVTELSVKISRFKDDDFVEDPRPLVLAPPGASVDAGVADLLSRVAPDRKKPGLNPSDTGPFEGKAGPQPENFRWEIESARGYPPR
jgi:GYF domain 2